MIIIQCRFKCEALQLQRYVQLGPADRSIKSSKTRDSIFTLHEYLHNRSRFLSGSTRSSFIKHTGKIHLFLLKYCNDEDEDDVVQLYYNHTHIIITHTETTFLWEAKLCSVAVCELTETWTNRKCLNVYKNNVTVHVKKKGWRKKKVTPLYLTISITKSIHLNIWEYYGTTVFTKWRRF